MKRLILGLMLVLASMAIKAQGWSPGGNEFMHPSLEFGTRRVVNTIDTICSDSAYVYMSIANAPGNTNNIQYKGAYGVYQVLGENNTVNVGDRITVIGDFYIMSTATTDTAYIFIHKQ